MTTQTRREKILAASAGMADTLLNGDGCAGVSIGDIVTAIDLRELTIPDIIAAFAVQLRSEIER